MQADAAGRGSRGAGLSRQAADQAAAVKAMEAELKGLHGSMAGAAQRAEAAQDAMVEATMALQAARAALEGLTAFGDGREGPGEASREQAARAHAGAGRHGASVAGGPAGAGSSAASGTDAAAAQGGGRAGGGGRWQQYDRAVAELAMQSSTEAGAGAGAGLQPGSFLGRLCNVARVSAPDAVVPVNAVLGELCNLATTMVVTDREAAYKVGRPVRKACVWLCGCVVVVVWGGGWEGALQVVGEW